MLIRRFVIAGISALWLLSICAPAPGLAQQGAQATGSANGAPTGEMADYDQRFEVLRFERDQRLSYRAEQRANRRAERERRRAENRQERAQSRRNNAQQLGQVGTAQ